VYTGKREREREQDLNSSFSLSEEGNKKNTIENLELLRAETSTPKQAE